MKALHKSYIVFSLALLLSIFVVFAAALTSSSVDPSNIDEDRSYLFNFTLNNSLDDATNITQVNITLPTGFSFTSFDTNGSSTALANFSNVSSTVLSWNNNTAEGFIVNQTTEYFWFNATASTPGTYNFTVTISDLSSGVNSTNVSVTVNDTTSPTIDYGLLTEVDANNLSKLNVVVNVTMTDNWAGVGTTTINLYNASSFLVSSVVSQNASFFFNFTGLSQGIYTFNATTNDTVGNVNNTSSRTVNLDTVPPTIAYESPTTDTTQGKNYSQSHIVFNISTSMPLGGFETITTYLYNSTNSLIETNTSTPGLQSFFINYTNLADGTYTFNASGNDSAGNIGYTAATRTVILDNVAPTIVYDAPTSQQDYNFSQTNININITAVDVGDAGLSRITIYLYNSSGFLIETNTSTTSSFFINYTGLTDGFYRFNATANDTAGNVNATITRNVTLDTTAPAATAVAAPATGTTNDSILVNYTVTDTVLVVTDFNITVNDTLTVTEYVMTQQGDNYIFYINISATSTANVYYNTTFRDSVGNINRTDTITVAVTDNDVPTWNETLVNQTIELGTAFYYDVNASDNIAVGTYFVDDVNNFTVNSASGLISNATYLSLSDIPLNISVNDTAGNTISVFINVSVVDTTIPVFSPALADQNVELGTAFNYDVNVTDFQTVTFVINDTTNFNISSTGLITNYTILALGAYGLQINATDASGNVNSSIITVTVGDSTPPVASGGSPTGTITDTTPELNVTSNENATCKFSVDVEYNYTTMNYTFTGTSLAHNYTLATVLTGSGTSHTIYSRCNDTTGNVATTSYSWSFTVGTAASSGGGSSGGSEISVTSNDLVNGKTLSVVKGDKISITLKGSSHSIEVESINSVLGKVTIIIRSDPISITLKEGETRFVDVDGDGAADLEITLKKIGLSGIDLEIKEVTVQVPSEEAVKEVVEEVSEDEQIKEIVKEIAREIEPTKFKMTNELWAGIVIAVIIVAFLAYQVLWPKYKKKRK